MKAVAIPCEYNPFHSGHAYQLAAARRESGADVTIAILSTQATQRGEMAVTDAYIRAETALCGGADLVVGLPFPFCAASAEFFASANVFVATSLGADVLHFGSECGIISPLQHIADLLSSEAYIEAMTKLQKQHPTLGTMETRVTALRILTGNPSLCCGSNDILGIAYLQAIRAQQSRLHPMTIRREGQAYHDQTALPADNPTFASASALRTAWKAQGFEAIRPHLTASTAQILQRACDEGRAPIFSEQLLPLFFSFYRLADPSVIETFAELQGGLARHIIAAARTSADVQTFFSKLSTRRYTTARLQRAMLFGICGVTPQDLRSGVPFVLLLGATAQGRAYLSLLRRKCSLPIVTKPADLPDTEHARHMAHLNDRLHALYTLQMPIPRDAAFFTRCTPWIEK